MRLFELMRGGVAQSCDELDISNQLACITHISFFLPVPCMHA